MKQVLTIILASMFALCAMAEEGTNGPVKEGKMLLAKKKDHSKDTKPAAPKKAEPKKK